MTGSTTRHGDHQVTGFGSEDEDVAERQDARAVLVQIGSPAVPLLLIALDTPQQQVLWEAAKSLAEIVDPAAAERLVAVLADEYSDMRWIVAEALIALGRDGLKPLLTVLTQPDLPVGVYEAAYHVLDELAEQGDLAALLAPVLEAFRGPHPERAIPRAATEVLKGDVG